MADKPKAERPSWNKEEFATKAKEKDQEAYEHAKAAEESLAKGHAPKKQSQYDDLPKPTELLKARTEDLGLTKNLNKTMLVTTSTTGKGPRGAGFYCELCNRTFKDSLAYLDHVNGRLHLLKLGQSTHVERSTLSQVRAKIASLRAATRQKVTAKNFDFQSRLKAVKNAQEAEKERRKEERRKKRMERERREERRRMGILDDDDEGNGDEKGEKMDVDGAEKHAKNGKKDKRQERKEKREQQERDQQRDKEVEKAIRENEDMSTMMGFGGFGTTKRK
ncbi:hypothetical protein I308_104519 [Cryptococcus tetragattii IND107]|uniref:C2H2-type domain-containing protein n=1 Tax=Cryptococcus tetragattii IND107 TaxID=1296105 RepID=A0ABR3BQG3_9TREE|nr:U4/U6.U5 tri-snRNP component SNU23 [Cryptococcus tetragattii IND107]